MGRLPPGVFTLGVPGVDIPPFCVLNPPVRRPRASQLCVDDLQILREKAACLRGRCSCSARQIATAPDTRALPRARGFNVPFYG